METNLCALLLSLNVRITEDFQSLFKSTVTNFSVVLPKTLVHPLPVPSEAIRIVWLFILTIQHQQILKNKSHLFKTFTEYEIPYLHQTHFPIIKNKQIIPTIQQAK